MTNYVKELIEFHASLYVNSFRIEFIPQDAIYSSKSITHNILTIQSDDTIMCGFYCITFI